MRAILTVTLNHVDTRLHTIEHASPWNLDERVPIACAMLALFTVTADVECHG
jgi:hypothetical protein